MSEIKNDAALEAACKAHCDYFGGEGWWESGLLADTKPKAFEAMQKAIAAWRTSQPVGGLREAAARIETLERELAAAKEALEHLYHEVEGMPFRNHAGALVSWKLETQGKIIAALSDGGGDAD